jgi:toxin FitB
VTTPTDSELFLVDSSGWVEYLGNGPKADAFGAVLSRENCIVVPTVVIYEVHKKLQKLGKESAASQFLSHAYRARIAPLDVDLAVAAAQVALQTRLAMADAMIYATAVLYRAQLVTQDGHFRGLAGVTLI